MEILRPGNRNRVQCGSCESQLKFDASDVSRRDVPFAEQYDEDDNYKYVIGCPECHMVIDVTSKVAPAIAKLIAEREIRLDYDL